MNKEIKEIKDIKNKALNEFMGYSNPVDFQKSWDELMRVVHKINVVDSKKHGVILDKYCVRVIYDDNAYFHEAFTIDYSYFHKNFHTDGVINLFDACSDFVIWKNCSKKIPKSLKELKSIVNKDIK